MTHSDFVLGQLKRLRKARKQTQATVAARAGIPRETYSRAESGTADAALSTIAAMAQALDAELLVVPRALRFELEQFIASGGRYYAAPPGVVAPKSRVR